MKGFLSPLTEEQARAIHADPRGYTRIALEYGISRMTVCNIKCGKTWKHLKLAHVGRRPSSYTTYKEKHAKQV